MRPSFATEEWVTLLGADPRLWLWDSGDATVRSLMLREGLAGAEQEDLLPEMHRLLLDDVQVRSLIALLPDWESVPVRGHNRPDFAPNTLNLLADMGVQGGDDPAIERLLDQMLAHQEPSGRFASFGIGFRGTTPVWGSVLCDNHAILECLVRYGRADDPAVQHGLARMGADMTMTSQGYAWPCVPHSVNGWRGPGRKGEFCPQVTLEALRVYAHLPGAQRPERLLEAAETSLNAWRCRGEAKPYMFGHGRQFKTVKWPPTWYDASSLLGALSSYTELQEQPVHRTALAELVACLAAYNFSPDGAVTPRSCYQGFEAYSFGQKKRPSAWATAYLCVILKRYTDLAGLARKVDVRQLSSSKGGRGTALPPK